MIWGFMYILLGAGIIGRIARDEGKYKELCNNMSEFADKYLSPEAVLLYLRNVSLKYGVKEKAVEKEDVL